MRIERRAVYWNGEFPTRSSADSRAISGTLPSSASAAQLLKVVKPRDGGVLPMRRISVTESGRIGDSDANGRDRAARQADRERTVLGVGGGSDPRDYPVAWVNAESFSVRAVAGDEEGRLWGAIVEGKSIAEEIRKTRFANPGCLDCVTEIEGREQVVIAHTMYVRAASRIESCRCMSYIYLAN